MPLLSLTLSGANGKPHDWTHVSTPLQEIQTILNTTGLDSTNIQENGILPSNVRTNANIDAVRIKIRNNTGGSLNAGTLVYFNGTYSDGTTNYPTVAKAVATASPASNYFAQGLLVATTANNADGTVALFYELSGVNTSSAAVGDLVYLDTTAGGWTRTRPTGGQFIQVTGTITVVHASTGRVVFSFGSVPEFLTGSTSGLGASLEALTVQSVSGAASDIYHIADAGEDNADKWKISVADGGTRTWQNYTSGSYVAKMTLDTSGNVTVAGELDAVTLDISGNADIDGTTNLDAVDIDGAVQIDSTVTVGVDDTGYDVKFFGDTASAYLLWDTSADKLLTAGGAAIDIVKDKLLIGGTAVTTTAAELNVLDAVSGGTVAASLAVVVDSNKDIGSFRNITLTGELDAGSLDVSGDADIDGTLEADAITLGGTALGSLYSPIAGSSSITTTGTVTSGTWSGVIDGSATMTQGSDATGDVYYRNASGYLTRLAASTDGYVLTTGGAGTVPAWEAIPTSSADITSVVAGAGMTGGATSGDATLNVIGGDGITANSDDVAITAAQTTITSVINTALALGRDADNQIKFGTDDQIVFEVAGGDGVTFKASGEIEATSLDISGDADIDGTLEADAITLGGTALGSLYSPIAGSSSIATVGTVGTGTWEGTAVALAYGGTGLVGATDGKIVIADGSGAPVLLDVGSSTAITVLGTVATGTWQGTAVASAYLDSDTAHLSTTQTFTGDKTFTGTLTVGADDTGKDVKFFGASAGAYMEWDESADQLRILGPEADATGSSGKLLLATAQTAVAANDVLGQIEFQAPLEAQDTDARAIAASIKAIAQDTFTASVNATDLIFYTGHSEAATEKFRFTSQGEIGIGGANYGSDGQVLTSGGAGAAPAWENAASGVSLSGTTNDTIATVTGANALQGEANLTFSGSVLTVAGTTNSKQLNVSASGAALASQNAAKIILVDLTDPGTMWDVEEFLMRVKFCSWYTNLGAFPMRGAMWIPNAGTSLVWWNLDTDAAYMTFEAATNKMLKGTSITDLAFLDGKIYAGGSHGIAIIDLMSDRGMVHQTGGINSNFSDIEARNTAVSAVLLTSSKGILNDTINAVDVTRDPDLVDEFDRPKHWWAIATATGPSVYSPVNDAVYDHNTTVADKSISISPSGMVWDNYDESTDGDTLGAGRFIRGISADFGNEIAIRFKNLGEWTDPGGSGKVAAFDSQIGPQGGVIVACNQGIGFIHWYDTGAATNGPDASCFFSNATYATPLMKGVRTGAYPLNDANDRSGVGNNLTGGSAPSYDASGPFGLCADFDGSSDYLLSGTFTSISSQHISLSLYFNADNNNPSATEILAQVSNSTQGESYTLGLTSSNGYLYWAWDDGGSSSGNITSAIDVCDGNWHHVYVTRGPEASSLNKIYCDGVLVASGGAGTNAGAVDVDRISLGARVDGSEKYNGQMAQVSISCTPVVATAPNTSGKSWTEAEINLEYQRMLRGIDGASHTLANISVTSVRIDHNSGLAAVTTAANQTEIWDVALGLRTSLDATNTANINDSDLRLKSGADSPEYITGRDGAMEFDGQARRAIG